MQKNQIENKNYIDLSLENGTYKTTLPKRFKPKVWKRPNPNTVKTFIPGTILTILVKKGQKVNDGEQLAIFAAMKMHNIILAPHKGKVVDIFVTEGERLTKGAPMFNIQ
ncbi:MAG: biotin/lipoyl-containing protein [Bacteroidales bacterium]